MTEKMVAPVLTEETIRKEIPENKGSSPPEAAGKKEKFFGHRAASHSRNLLHHIVTRGSVKAALRRQAAAEKAPTWQAICCWHSPAMRSSAALSGAKAGLSCRGCCRYG